MLGRGWQGRLEFTGGDWYWGGRSRKKSCYSEVPDLMIRSILRSSGSTIRI